MRLKYSTIFAFLYSLVGILIGLDIMNKMNESYHLFIFILPIAFFISSMITWKYIIDKPISVLKNEPYQSRVIFTGFLTGIISHPLSFLFMGFLIKVLYWIPFSNSYDYTSSNNWEEILFATFIGPIFSLILYGWATVSSGIIIAVLFIFLNNYKMKTRA